MKIMGVTGGIGSGKSVFVTLLATYDVPVYLADEESKRLTATSPVLRERLTALLGDAAYDANGLNRRWMASRIFHDARLLEQVNAIIHPEVARHFRSWTQQHVAAGWVALESAILFESGFDRGVDLRVTVYAPKALRIKRVMERDGIGRADVLSRMQHQLPDEIKKKRSDYVIFNDEKHALIPQTDRFMARLRSLFPAAMDSSFPLRPYFDNTYERIDE